MKLIDNMFFNTKKKKILIGFGLFHYYVNTTV